MLDKIMYLTIRNTTSSLILNLNKNFLFLLKLVLLKHIQYFGGSQGALTKNEEKEKQSEH